MKSLIERIFTLPPVEKRRMIGDPLRKWMFGNFTPESNDTYIYYLTFKYSFIVCLVFSALNWVSYTYSIVFDFWLFRIFIPRQQFNEAFLFSYPFYMSAILWLGVLPFFFFLFRKNVDWKNFDPTWTLSEERKRKLADIPRRIKSNRFIIIVLLLLMPAIGPIFYWLCKKFNLYESSNYFFFTVLSIPFLLAIYNYALLVTVTAFQRYKYSRKELS